MNAFTSAILMLAWAQRLCREIRRSERRKIILRTPPQEFVEAEAPPLFFNRQTKERTATAPGSRTRQGSYRAMAKHLGVRHEHLWLVLNGKRRSHSLLQRYNAAVAAGIKPCGACSSSAKPRAGRNGARGATRFPGITQHARLLGVDRASLWRALTGKWDLPILKQRYQELIKREGGA